jgi:hypothetical protein
MCVVALPGHLSEHALIPDSTFKLIKTFVLRLAVHGRIGGPWRNQVVC